MDFLDISEASKVIARCQEFLNDFESNCGADFVRQLSTLESIDNFWTEERTREWKRSKRKNLAFNKIGTLCDNTASEFVNAGWHINVEEDDLDKLQDRVNAFESLLGSKVAQRQAFYKSCVCGNGFAFIGIDTEDNPFIECVNDNGCIAIDPWSTDPSLKDAERGAIVKVLPKYKAKREFPNCEKTSCLALNFKGLATRWMATKNSVQVVSYYEKDENGLVTLYKICGEQVKAVPLNISIVPIIRFSGFPIYKRNGKTKYIGLADKLNDLALGENIGYSSLVERTNRVMKSKVAMSDKALQGEAVLNGIQKCENEESIVLPYHFEGGAPVLLEEHFNTDDLGNVINISRVLQQDVLGGNLTGDKPIEQTATESLLQQVNSVSNKESLFLNAEIASHTIAEIILQICANAPATPIFSLQGGVSSIQQLQKERQGIANIGPTLASSPLLAYYQAKTLHTDFGDNLAKSILANNPDLVIVDDLNEGILIQEMNKAKTIAEQALQTAEELNAQLQDAQRAEAEATLALQNAQQSYALQVAKFEADNAKWRAEFMLKCNESAVDIAKVEAETAETIAKAEKTAQETDETRTAISNDAFEKGMEVGVKQAESVIEDSLGV